MNKWPTATLVTCSILAFYGALVLGKIFGEASGRWNFQIPQEVHYIMYGTVFAAVCVYLVPIAANLERIAIAFLTARHARRQNQIEETWKGIADKDVIIDVEVKENGRAETK